MTAFTLNLLCLSLMSATGWYMPALPVLHRRAQCVSCQTSTRHAMVPQMCSDHLSSEFQRFADQRSGTVFGDPASLLRQYKMDAAWVLLFNAGQRNEGVYTLQGREKFATNHGTYVLAFERHGEASRFAMLLQAQGFDMATATKWTSALLGKFCSMAGFKLGFVPDEALVVPPKRNVFVEQSYKQHELADPPQTDSVEADAFAMVPDTADESPEEEDWGCKGAKGAELCANLERLFDLE